MTRRVELGGLLAILVLGAALRLVAPAADVPLRVELTDAPNQDAWWYLEAATGPAEGLPRDLEPITAYDPPVWVHGARVWFRCLGVSLITAQALGALISLATVLLVWRLTRAALGPVEGLSAAVVLATLYPFVWLSRTTLVYGPAALALTVAVALAWLGGRPPPRGRGWLEGASWLALLLGGWTVLEVGSTPGHGRALALLLAGVVFAGWSAVRRRRPPLAWRVVTASAAWTIVLTTALALRPPAVAAAGGLALVHVARARRPLRTIGALTGGAALALALVVLVDPGGVWVQTLDRFERYVQPESLSLATLSERVLRLGGEPRGGSGTGFLGLAPGAVLAAMVGALALFAEARGDPRRRDALALFGGWAAAFLAGAVLSDYRPLRYFAVVCPPLAVFAAVGVGRLLRAQHPPLAPRTLAATAWLTLWGAVAASHALEQAAGPSEVRDLVFAGVGGAAIAVALAALSTRITPPTRRLIGLLLLGAATAPGAAACALDLARPGRSTREANRAAAAALGQGASLVGPHASVLALGHGIERRRAPWIVVSPELAATTIARMRALGVTHLALGLEQAASSGIVGVLTAHGAEPALVGVFLPRGTPVLLLRLPWSGEHGYRLSAFETRRLEDAIVGVSPGERSAEVDPDLLLLRVRALAFQGEPHRALEVLEASQAETPALEPVTQAARLAVSAGGLR